MFGKAVCLKAKLKFYTPVIRFLWVICSRFYLKTQKAKNPSRKGLSAEEQCNGSLWREPVLKRIPIWLRESKFYSNLQQLFSTVILSGSFSLDGSHSQRGFFQPGLLVLDPLSVDLYVFFVVFDLFFVAILLTLRLRGKGSFWTLSPLTLN